MKYPYLNNEQVKSIKTELVPKLKEIGINNIEELEEAQAEGLEWLELFEDYIYPDNLSHISNEEFGLSSDASEDVRDEFFNEFGASSEWTMVTNLVWEWLEDNKW